MANDMTELADDYNQDNHVHPDDLICPRCGGSGTVPDNGTNCGECEDCEGTGEIQ